MVKGAVEFETGMCWQSIKEEESVDYGGKGLIRIYHELRLILCHGEWTVYFIYESLSWRHLEGSGLNNWTLERKGK